MSRKWILFALACLLLLCPSALASENLLTNGDIETIGGDGQPSGWSRTMWYWDEGISEFSVSSDAFQSAHALCIQSYGENDARFQQSIDVKPDTCYRISAMIKAEGCDESEAGAGLAIDNTFVSSELLHDTHGAWRSVTLYGRTAPDQRTITLMARLGGYGSLNVGSAWFDDIVVEEVAESEAGGNVQSLATLAPSGGAIEDTQPQEVPWTGIYIAIAMAFALIAGALLLGNARRKTELLPVKSPVQAFAIIAGVALILRAVIAVTVRGYPEDMSCFEGWASRMADLGPARFYSSEAFCDYPPGYLYVLWLLGTVMRALSMPIDGQATWLLIKFIPIAMDIVAAIIVFQTVRASYDDRVGLLLAALFAFNPASILNSAAWGQIDAVLTALLIVSLSMATRGHWFISLPVFAVAILVKPQALLLAPLGLLMIIVEVVASEEKGRLALRLVGAIALSLVLMFALALPFISSLPADLLPKTLSLGPLGSVELSPALKPIGFMIELYGGTMNHYDYITVNACNLYTLLGMNWKPLTDLSALTVFASLMMGLAYVYAGFLYVRAKDRGKIFLVSAMLLTMVFAVAPMMHERYLYPVLLMLLVAYAFDRDARLLIAFVLLSVTQFLNVALVLQYRYLMNDNRQLLYGAISLANVLAAAFLGWTGWEMCVTGRMMSLMRVYKPTIANGRDERATSSVQDALLRPRDARLNLKRRDFIFMIALTLLYAVASFANLGSMEAPQSQWRSTASDEQITFDLGEVRDFHMTYFGGICNSSFLVEMSDDATVWSEARNAGYEQGDMYRWLWYEDELYTLTTARYIRLTAEMPGLLLGEIAFIDEAGTPLPIASVYSLGGGEGASDPTTLIDEQRTVPPYPSYINGMYFDEIYHGRTAYEHLHGLQAYEGTHPPLGKVLIMVGIELFGMTPFGWRFVPALFGVLMVPLMYLLAKQLFKRSTLALIAAFLLAADCMHFTQSRFATLDAIAVFFIMLMYLFMIRYAQMSFYHQKLSRTLVPLGLAGVTMGLAIATKWIGLYAAIGLAFIFFFTLSQRLREYRYAKLNLRTLDVDQRRVAQRAIKQFGRNTLLTIAFCLVFFIAIPALIYYFSFYWQMKPDGGLTLERVWAQQKYMLGYHSGGALEHGYSSRAIEWPLIVKPMWYYTGSAFMPEGMVSSISCMGNPVVWWGGLIAMIWVLLRLCISNRGDRRYLFIVVGYISQYLPWAFITRSTFIYHYFASVPFIILATVAVFEWVRKKSMRAYKIAAFSYCGLALLMFAAFFPLMSGLPAPRSYVKYLRWFNWSNY